MITRFNFIAADWTRVKNHCRTTANKEFTDKDPPEKFRKALLISEHTPIRLIEIDWSWQGIKSWVATHWSRHKFEKYISSQRDDRKVHVVSRDKMPQDTPVNFDGYANEQQLIDAFRKRLCFQASPETRELAVDFKMALEQKYSELADVLVPNCVYRCGCPEFTPCGFWERFLASIYKEYGCEYVDARIYDIQWRYDRYNDFLKKKEGGTD